MNKFGFVSDNRLRKQFEFIHEIDKLKSILRRTRLSHTDERSIYSNSYRLENSAEHSWHLAMMAMILSEYAPPDVDISKVIKMLLIHDLVEIYAGDTFVFDTEALQGKEDRELEAANALFSLLPPDQEYHFKQLWLEFENHSTPEAHFAFALDKLNPLFLHWGNKGTTLTHHKITASQMWNVLEPVRSYPELWNATVELLKDVLSRCPAITLDESFLANIKAHDEALIAEKKANTLVQPEIKEFNFDLNEFVNRCVNEYLKTNKNGKLS